MCYIAQFHIQLMKMDDSEDRNANVCMPIIDIFNRLDIMMSEGSETGPFSTNPTSDFSPLQKENAEIERVLECSIQSFTAQWLPLYAPTPNHYTAEDHASIARKSWRLTRTQMLKAINLTSYRSVLALYLFSQTSTPPCISADEMLTGLNAPMCLQTALHQIQQLRQRSGRYQSNSMQHRSPSLWPEFIDLENRAYWAAILWDTSFSFSIESEARSTLTSGLNGACTEPAWRIVRSFLVGSLATRLTSMNECVDGTNVYEIVAGAQVAIAYVWKNISSLKEALREGVDETDVLFVWSALNDALEIYETLVRPSMQYILTNLDAVEEHGKRIWYEASLGYSLGALVLGQTLRGYHREDLQGGICEMLKRSEREAWQVLEIGMSNVYGYIEGCGKGGEVVGTFIATDPFPQNVASTLR